MLYTLLQTYPAGSSGFMALGGNAGYFLLIVLIGIAGYIVQARLQSVFAKYAREPIPGGMTGAEVAEKMLRENHVHNVKITHVSGHLTDHFNPQTMTVNLSDSVYASQSISALAVACHECGHAVQHAQGYAPLVLRSQLVPLVSFASRTAQWVIIIGLIILASTNNAVVAWSGIGLIGLSALFSVITLPVEYNASARALAWLESSRTLQGEQIDHARVALRWAARTYLVAALGAIASVLYYVMLVMGGRRND